MSGQTGTQETQSVQTTQLPPWIDEAAQQNYALAQNAAMRPLMQYQGQMVPDVGPQLQQSWNTANQAGDVGAGAYTGAAGGFAGVLAGSPQQINAAQAGRAAQANAAPNVTAAQSGLSQLSKTNLSPYMNPYTSSVINATLPIYQQQLALQEAGNANQANAAGAFGGSRFGVQQGVTGAQGAMGMAQMAEQLNQANFAQAQQAGMFDVGAANQMGMFNTGQQNQVALANQQQANQVGMYNAGQANNVGMFNAGQQNQVGYWNQAAGLQQENLANQASAGLAALGNDLVGRNQTAFNEQTAAGAEQQGYVQDQINAQMAKFNQAWNYPTTQLGVVQSALGMTPYGQTTTGQQNTQTQTPMDWGALAGSALKLIPGLSDKRLKTNIKRVGKSAAGTNVYQFHWKGEPKSAPKTQGPIAQEVEQKIPGAVATHPPTGVKLVHPAVMGVLSRPAPQGVRGAMGHPLTPLQHTERSQAARAPRRMPAGALVG